MKSLTLRGLLWVIGTFNSAYHNYYLSEVCDVVICPNPNSYWSELSLQQCFMKNDRRNKSNLCLFH